MITNANISGYCFDMNLNIWGDFQVCISVPLILVQLFFGYTNFTPGNIAVCDFTEKLISF